MSTIREARLTGAAPQKQVSQRHFLSALERVMPSVTRRDEHRYNALHGKLRLARSSISADSAPTET